MDDLTHRDDIPTLSAHKQDAGTIEVGTRRCGYTIHVAIEVAGQKERVDEGLAAAHVLEHAEGCLREELVSQLAKGFTLASEIE